MLGIHGQQILTEALELPWSLPLGTTDKELISSSRDQGIPVVRGLLEPGHGRMEWVGGSYTLLAHLCDFSSGVPLVPPCSSRVVDSPLAPWAASLHTLQHLWALSVCSANEGPIFHLLKSSHLFPSVFAIFKLTKSLTLGMKIYSNINLDPTQLCQTSCNWDFSLEHICKGDKFIKFYITSGKISSQHGHLYIS